MTLKCHYLISNQHIITYDWTDHGQVTDIESLAAVGLKEFNGVVDADMLIMIMPARKGSHVEFGVALALGKPIIIITGDQDFEHKSFYYLDNVHIMKDVIGLNDLIHKLLLQDS